METKARLAFQWEGDIKGKRLLFNLSFSACIILLALILPISTLAVITFEKTYGGPDNDIAYSIQQTVPDGVFIIAGHTQKEAEYYSLSWDGRDSLEKKVPSGIYFYRLTSEIFNDTKRLTLSK